MRGETGRYGGKDMVYDFTVLMALVDYLPVLFYGIAAVLLIKEFYGKMRPGAFVCFAAGATDVFTAGFLKATWKLLYATGACDFEALNSLFMPLQSVGFLLAGVGILLYVCTGKKEKSAAAMAVVPPVFGGTFVFIAMMVAGLGAVNAGLSILAARRKKGLAILFFALCFVCSMGMGYLASRDSASAAVNWIEQTVNCVGQGCLLMGVLIMRKGGKNA